MGWSFGTSTRHPSAFLLARVRRSGFSDLRLALGAGLFGEPLLRRRLFLGRHDAFQYGSNGRYRRTTVTFGVTGNSCGVSNPGAGLLVRLPGGAPSSESPQRMGLRQLGRWASAIAASTHGGIISLIVT